MTRHTGGQWFTDVNGQLYMIPNKGCVCIGPDNTTMKRIIESCNHHNKVERGDAIHIGLSEVPIALRRWCETNGHYVA